MCLHNSTVCQKYTANWLISVAAERNNFNVTANGDGVLKPVPCNFTRVSAPKSFSVPLVCPVHDVIWREEIDIYCCIT